MLTISSSLHLADYGCRSIVVPSPAVSKSNYSDWRYHLHLHEVQTCYSDEVLCVQDVHAKVPVADSVHLDPEILDMEDL